MTTEQYLMRRRCCFLRRVYVDASARSYANTAPISQIGYDMDSADYDYNRQYKERPFQGVSCGAIGYENPHIKHVLSQMGIKGYSNDY